MRRYTLEEARTVLPRVIPLLEQLRDAFVKLRALQSSFQAQSRGASGDGSLVADPWAAGGEDRMEVLNRGLRSAAGELDSLGIEVKDPERGLIDFYSERDGEVVYLCYLLGEPDIAFWHRLAGGFAGRQPL
jgi:hypothetical protein